jgi:uncharacterized protein YlzI (FlbEa/FlbD family)
MILATLVLILLHGPNGHEILINPHHVTSLAAKISGEPSQRFADGVNCMVNLADGKYHGVVESCEEISRAISQPRKPKP